MNKQIPKNRIAKIQVLFVKKFPEPVAPKTVFDAPAPNDAPIPAPLPCCTKIKATIAIATNKNKTITTSYIEITNIDF